MAQVGEQKKKNNAEFYVQIVIITILVGLLMYSLGKGSNQQATGSGQVTGGVIGTVSASEIIPTGVPKVYGEELGVKYDDISPQNPQLADSKIAVLGNIDVSETLEGANLQRYIYILYELENGISCEYCCGARAVIFSNGDAACGCAHSYAMRGLAKYLIKYHGDEFSDEEILEELGKWKVLFFPEIHETKAAILKANGIELNYINLASNKYRGIEQGQASGGGMVGGC